MTEELKRKIGQLFMAGFPDDGLNREYIDFCEKYYIGNFTVNANHCVSTEGLCDIIKKTRENTYRVTGQYPLIEIDQEGGWVTRFYEGAAMLSGAMSYTASGADADKMYRVGKRIGGILRAVGCNVNDCPVLDVNIDPDNPIIGTRSYGEDAEAVIKSALPFMKGMQSQKIISAVKHYPGHGNVSGDTHLDVVHNNVDADTLRKTEFLPFKTLFDEGAGAIMTAHVVHDAFSSVPSTVSYEIMTELLRDEQGFRGLAITDAMGMLGLEKLYPDGESAVRAILAGCDVLLYYNFEYKAVENAMRAVYAAVESGEITEERIDLSYNRIVAQKEKFDIASAEPDLELAKKLIYNEAEIAENFEDKLSAITCIKDDGVLSSLADKRILCISPICDALRGVEEERRQILSFADIFGEVFENAEGVVSSLEGLTTEVEEALAGEFDVAVVGIFDARNFESQLEIVEAALKTGKPVVAVLLRTPYDYRYVKDCNAVITGYEYTMLAAKAIAAAMKNCDYRGEMPVTLPGI